ncbi:hypothetical protein [Mycoplasma anserisalpingitidis]|nr:hypothetical protein [Mycoplasma anserisalpingitidis]
MTILLLWNQTSKLVLHLLINSELFNKINKLFLFLLMIIAL